MRLLLLLLLYQLLDAEYVLDILDFIVLQLFVYPDKLVQVVVHRVLDVLRQTDQHFLHFFILFLLLQQSFQIVEQVNYQQRYSDQVWVLQVLQNPLSNHIAFLVPGQRKLVVLVH